MQLLVGEVDAELLAGKELGRQQYVVRGTYCAVISNQN